jgi:hypothetical protein
MAVAALVLSFLTVSHPVRAESSAPFGLTWGMNLEALEALGIESRPLFTEGPDSRVVVRKLPKMLGDMAEATLWFGPDDRLHRIESRGVDVRHDEDGSRLKARYNALSRALSQKYGKGETRHEIFAAWTKPSDFLMGIYRGDTKYYTLFTSKDVDVRLEIRATRRFVGHYLLVFDYKGGRDKGNGVSRERDIL